MYRYPIALVALLLLFAACDDQPSGPHPDDAAERSAALVKGEAGDIDLRDRHIVVFRDDIGNPDALVDQLTRGNESRVHYRYRHAVKGFCATIPEQALEAIARNPNVDYIEADAPMSIFWTKQESIHISWGLDRIDQRDLPLDNIYWYDANGSDVTAYIIDTGIRYTHDDFKDANNNSRASFGFDAFGGNGSDGNGHGTHVAGTVGGTFWGVAKNVNLVSVRVLDNNGGGTVSGVIAGVDWVQGNFTAPAVANMSLGGGASTTLDQAVANAVSAGVTFVVSAGNNNRDACRYSPAREPSAITVGATTSSDSRASYSNYGSCVDIFAPGSSITSAHNSSDNATAVFSGTSMAAPHVAGVAALYLESNSNATAGQVMNAILGSGTQGVLVGNLGRGSPNLLLYSLFAGTPPTGGLSAPSGLAASVVSQTQIDVSWNLVSGATEYESEMRVQGSSAWTSSGTLTTTTHSWTSLSANTTYEFRVRAGDGSNWSSWSSEISATTLDNPPSTPTGLAAATVSSSQINTSWNAVSNATEYEVRIRDASSNTSTVSTSSTSHSWSGLSASSTYYFSVRAGNSGGWSAWSSDVSATTDDPPQSVTAYITAATGSSASVNPANWAATLTVEVRDAQSGGNPVPGATVTITWSGDASGSGTAVTNSSGIASVTTDNLHVRKVSSVSMTVSDVTGSNINYGGPASTGLLPVIVNQ